MISSLIVDLISKSSPYIGTLLGGPLGGLIGSLVSKALGGIDMNDPQNVITAIQSDPEAAQKLKELEMQLKDLQSARDSASKDKGMLIFIRPLLILLAHVVLAVNIYLITIATNDLLVTVLLVFMYVLVSEIRQMYKFYFGNGDDITPILSKRK